MERGFSLSEVVVSLLLVTSISLALLKQQWQLHRLVHQVQQQTQRFFIINNERERAGVSMLKQQGLSLMELMVALVLAMGIISLITQQYLQIAQAFQTLQTTITQASRMQLTLDFLRSTIQTSGFTPCLPINHLITHPNVHAVEWDAKAPDKIRIHRMQNGFSMVGKIENQHRLYVSAPISINPLHPVIIADCYHAEVHHAYQMKGSVLQLDHALRFTYHPPVYVGEWTETSFFLKANREGGTSLFYDEQHPEELISNVKTMTFRMESMENKTLVHLDLVLDNASVLPIDIRVRNS